MSNTAEIIDQDDDTYKVTVPVQNNLEEFENINSVRFKEHEETNGVTVEAGITTIDIPEEYIFSVTEVEEKVLELEVVEKVF